MDVAKNWEINFKAGTHALTGSCQASDPRAVLSPRIHGTP